MIDLSLHLMDIIQNSIVVGSSYVEVVIKAESDKNCLTLSIQDDGCGMTEETIKKVTDPFFTTRTTRKTGLGIPLFAAAAEMAGGNLKIESEVGVGTTVTATFMIDNIDRKPLGDIADTMSSLIMAHPEMEFHLILTVDDSSFEFRTEEAKEQIGGLPINDVEIIAFIKSMIEEQVNKLFGGILNEITG